MSPESPLAGTRVAIVCGHFSPEIGYQEVDLAKAFVRLGAQVRVVTTTRPSRNARAVVRAEYPSGVSRAHGYEIVRLLPRLALGPNVLGCKTLPIVRDFGPDHVVLVGPGKMFGLDLFSSEKPPWRRIAIVQDNSEDGRSRGGRRWSRATKGVAHRLLKRPAYRRVVRGADRVVLNVPETREIISAWLTPTDRDRLARTGRELRLGFDPETFYFDLAEREGWRRRHSVGDDQMLLVTCTRATAEKKLEEVMNAVSGLRAQGVAVRYVLAGLLEDEYGARLRAYAASQPDPSAFVLLPVLGHTEMRQLFSACDLGFWPQAAITIQQAMGTGLPVVLRNRPSVSHLVVTGRNGWYVQPHQDLAQAIAKAIEDLRVPTSGNRLGQRRARADFNLNCLSYDEIALEIVR